MKKISCPLVLGLILSMMVSFGGEVSAQNKPSKVDITIKDIDIRATPSPPPTQKDDKDPCTKYQTDDPKAAKAAESIRLFYIRSASTMVEVLTEINDKGCPAIINAEGDNVIVLYGYPKQREDLKRVITILDLPRERVNLGMWGILISSKNPTKLAEVMREVNQEIDKTRRLLQETYQALGGYARGIEIDNKYGYKDLFEQQLRYRGALDPTRPSLSMIDILLRINAADDPIDNSFKIAKDICKLFFGNNANKDYEYYTYKLALQGKRPFENFLSFYELDYGLNKEPNKIDYSKDGDKKCNDQFNKINGDSKTKEKILENNLNRRKAILDFALQYSRLVRERHNFDPEVLQQSAEALNSTFNPLVDAINTDIQELFIEPTLEKIQRIVRKHRGVEYAEVGQTTVATLNGIPSEVSSSTLSTFEENPPLRLNELLEEAGGLNKFAEDLFPVGSAGNVPASSIVSLISALSADRSLWRELPSGVSLKITPSVLRNSASAELIIDLAIGPPGNAQGTNAEGKLRPLSRINENKVKTSVYVNTLDLFALSGFNNQTTVDGGRSYIPVIGTVWQGIFSGIPGFGELFSWKNPPKNVLHQSIVLTNSFIVPTAMGLAPLYPQGNSSGYDYHDLCTKVENYKKQYTNWIEGEKAQYQPQKDKKPADIVFSSSSYSSDQNFHDICGKQPETVQKSTR